MFGDSDKSEDTRKAGIFKVVPMGDGSVYGWKKFSEDGEVLEESKQTWPAAMDAEKAARASLVGEDRFETEAIHNINPEANTNVDLVKKPSEVKDQNAGMTLKDKGVEEVASEKAEADREE